jgi:adenine-specific DNA-methyltransferase
MLLQKSYYGKIKMIFIDPPYNTGNDMIYKDNYENSMEGYLEQTGQTKGGVRMTANPETSGRFHSDWLTMMYPRLLLANNLLKEDGSIFVSIDDNEVHNLAMMMNEIFGEENFLGSIIWEKNFSPRNDVKTFSSSHDYILVYGKNRASWETTGRNLLPRTEKQDKLYTNPDNDPRGNWQSVDLSVKTYTKAYDYPIKCPSGREAYPPKGRAWQTSKERVNELIKDNRIWFGKSGDNQPRIKVFLSEVQQGIVPTTLWKREEVGDTQEAKRELISIFDGKLKFNVTPKPVRLILKILKISTNKDDIILDFFSGTGTTAHAVLKENYESNGKSKRFICVQLPEKIEEDSEEYEAGYETIADICKERIRRAAKKIKEESKQQKLTGTKQDLGFKVFKLAKSNYRIWDDYDGKDADELKKQAELFSKPLVDGYDDTDVIYEVIVKEGYGLNSRIEKVDVSTNNVYRVTDDNSSFFITLDAKIDAKTLDVLDLSKDTTLVCIDDSLDDSQKNNISMRCNLKTI